jgi:hypothetical protein
LSNSDIFGEDGFSLGESKKEETERRLIDKLENKEQVWPLGGTFTGIANLVPSDEPGVRDWYETGGHALENAIPIAGLGIIPEEIYTGAQEVRKKLQLKNIKAGKPGPIDLPAFRKELAEWAAGDSNTAQLAGNAQEARNAIHKMTDADLTKLLEGINKGESYHVDHLGAVNKGVAPTVQPANAARIQQLYRAIDVIKNEKYIAHSSERIKMDAVIKDLTKQIEKLQNIKSPTPHLGVVNLPWRGDVLDARLTRVPWYRRGSKTLRTMKGIGGAVAAMGLKKPR